MTVGVLPNYLLERKPYVANGFSRLSLSLMVPLKGIKPDWSFKVAGQQKGIGYEQTFAPVTKTTTVRSIIAVVAMKHWHVWQMDVTNVFVHVDLDEEPYMRRLNRYPRQEEPIS